MLNDQVSVFTNRREAIALFNMLRGRDPRRPWPILPILSLTAKSGGGKSAMIDWLRAHKCWADGGPALPYAYLDFSQPHTPKDTLHILVSIRNQLQGHADGTSRNLIFPRFDLGAAIALAAPAIETLPSPNHRELEVSLNESVPLFNALHRLKTPLESVVPAVPYLLEALLWPGEFRSLQAILQRLEKEHGWQWYRDCTNDSVLRNARALRDVLLRVQTLSTLESREREYLIEELLPAALVADLLDGLVTRESLYCWDKTTNAVIFFDGFEALLEKTNLRGYRLLEILAMTEQRLRSESDPLLIVLGTSKPLFPTLLDTGEVATLEEQVAPIFARRYARRRVRDWLLQLPEDKSAMRLNHLILPLHLQELDTRGASTYLARLDEQRDTHVFDDEALVKVISSLTDGQPLSLTLAAAAALEAAARGTPLDADELRAALHSDALTFGKDEDLLGYLLDLFLRQLPEDEQRQMILSAMPRMLDAPTLGAALQLSDEQAAARWEYYRSLPSMRPLGATQLAFPPQVRARLLKKLQPTRNQQSDYYQTHNRLRAHFIRYASITHMFPDGMNSEQAQIEAAYHALALGQPDLAIALALAAQQSQSAYWEPLLESVSQAPGDLMALETEQRASSAMNRARQNHDIQDVVTALVLYRWLLNASEKNQLRFAKICHNLAITYNILPGGERHTNLRRAITYCQTALPIFQSLSLAYDVERAQKSLEHAQGELQSLSASQVKQRDVIIVAQGR